MKNELYTRIYKKAFVFLVVFLVFGVAFGLASSNFQKIKADTQYYDDLSPYVMNDWENYTTETKNGITMTNNGDGTLTLSGQTSVITEFYLPLKITSTTNSTYYSIFLACALNNNFTGVNDQRASLYIGYNSGQNVTNRYVYMDQFYSSSNINLGNRNNLCLVLRTAQNADFTTPVVITPFLYLREYPNGTSAMGQNNINLYVINSLLGPQGADLTKVNYIQEASNISLEISSQINKSFGNELEELIQYTMQAGDEITVDNTGVATNEIDLLTMTAGNDIYKMTFVNDALSNNYNNILLYRNNDTTIFYNDNLGELSTQNITNFREWAANAIAANATITSASANNNNILNKIFVYSTGTNYDTGYTAGYNDARQDVEEEIQEAFGEGLSQGYGDGYTTGYGEGYDQGAIEGVDSSWLINLFGAIDAFFAIHLFPNLTFGTIFAIPFVLSIAWVIIRILRGGGYGD